VATIGELALVTKSDLTSSFGPKTAQTLYNFARGIDDRPLITNQPRQSVSAEVNVSDGCTEYYMAMTFLTFMLSSTLLGSGVSDSKTMSRPT
jgi:nucleotidyltransferase/DNA polymerase involved in DNA repair